MFARIQHVGLQIDDLETTRAFYRGVLGFEELTRRPFPKETGLWFDIGNGQMVHMLVPLPDPTVPTIHFALEVDDIAQYERLFAQHGVPIQHRPYVPGAGRQIFVRDPSRNIIELNQPDDPAR